MKQSEVKKLILAALFTVLIIIGAHIAIPVPGTPVPVVLQNMFVLMAGLLLGWKLGTISVLAYLLLGILGLPVFSRGTSGLVHLIGPTGGYLVSYIAAVFLTGLIANWKERYSWIRDLLALIIGVIVIYLIGFTWLKFNKNISWTAAFLGGVAPFLPGGALKIAVAVLIAKAFRTEILRMIKSEK